MKSRLLFDGMLGRLCRKMRLLGYDARLLREGEGPRLLLDAEREGRVAVTASSRQQGRPGPAPVVVRRIGLAAEVSELFGALRDLTGEEPIIEPFVRCLECNVLLEDLLPDEVADSIPERVRERCTRYVRCPSCGRIYWEGSHWEAMHAQVERITARLKAEGLIAGKGSSEGGAEKSRDMG